MKADLFKATEPHQQGMSSQAELRIFIGAILSKARKAAGKTQAQIAAEVGCTTNFVSIVEAGKTGIPTPRVMQFAEACGLGQDGALVIFKKLHPEEWEAICQFFQGTKFDLTALGQKIDQVFGVYLSKVFPPDPIEDEEAAE